MKRARLPAVSDYALKLSELEQGRYRFMAESAARMEADLWARAGVREGASIADVGCGPGAVSAVLGEMVGPTGSVRAVDQNPEAVEAARATAAQAGLANVTAQVGEADSTGLEPGSVDLVMIRHVLAHNGGREQAVVDHAATLVRPGGCVYLADIDMSAFRARPPVPEFDEIQPRYDEWHRRKGNDLAVGLRLGEFLVSAGMEDVEHHGRYHIFPAPKGLRMPAWAARDALVEAGLATADELARWKEALDRRDASPDRPTMFVPLFFALGRRPGG